MMEVYWLEQAEADLPEDDDWLSAGERAQLSALRFPKRRRDWRLGRWTAKHAFAACLGLPADHRSLANTELIASPSGEPGIFILDERAPVTISISHSAGMAVCAIALTDAALGCDLERIEPRCDAFVRDYFTGEEQELLAESSADLHSLLVNLLWSAKESALKALHEGLRLDTRCVVVSPASVLVSQVENVRDNAHKEAANQPDSVSHHLAAHTGWHSLLVRHAHGQTFHGWWQTSGSFVRTMVSSPLSAPPVFLDIRP